ncbi:T9SS type A sorting domain-containing protein [Crocinitomix algicola]|uniref:T9SS type A sorting domain-containing protein n=1 Tax=Crocinitomix algicola TaxID=1740263 RepID=UPI000BBA36D4|nr:T9SS type A sorting domain-containing protein [Crocinitomix algicola]
MKNFALLLFGLMAKFTIYAQIVNGYARVTNITGLVYSIDFVDESADTFEDEEWIVIIQIQDNVIDGIDNNASFGSLGDIESAGLYEIRQIDSHTETAGVPTSITIKNATTNTFNTGTNSSVQIVTLREFGSPDYTTTSDMEALPWDGNIGGVLAIYVPGILTLEHDLTADNAGFRGGATNLGGSTGCTPTGAYRVIEQDNHANKGEGIYRNTTANQVAGRGRILNGGGGGNSHNAGGGGGGNYSAGGLGGPGWNNCSPSAGGLGGLSLSGEASVDRIFMGGGGGAGEGNNNYATEGADGGGIVLVKAEEIRTISCAGVNISADGASILIAPGNDGGGGGGAGGTIVFEVDTWNIDSDCPLTISSNGGDGGSVGNSGTHGGGGGGGQGVIYFSTIEPTANVTVETLTGDGGCNNNSSPCNSQAANGVGPDNTGILDILTGPLPIELIEFEASLTSNSQVQLSWTTKSERNNDYFTLEHSVNGVDWTAFDNVDGAGNSVSVINYEYTHLYPEENFNYYRLKQVDFNGAFSYSNVESVFVFGSDTYLYPNPTDNIVTLHGENLDISKITVLDELGRIIHPQVIAKAKAEIVFNFGYYESGIYFIRIETGSKNEIVRLSVIK